MPDPEFDALLDEALAIADADKRRSVMAKIQKLIQDERRDHPAPTGAPSIATAAPV